MRARIIVAIMALFLFTASGATAQTPEMVERVGRELTLKRLQGVWIPDLLITTQGAKAYPLAGRSLAFLEGNNYCRYEGDRNVLSGTFKVEDGYLRIKVDERNPWDLETADNKQKLQYAFSVEGDVLTLCYSVGDKVKADDLTPGEGRLVVVYKRKASGKKKTEECK